MSYIRIERFWDFQNADAWKKAAQAKKDSSRHPNWCKLVVRRDYEMDQLPIPTRLVYLELLRLATQHSNVIPNESEWIANQVSMDAGDVAQALHQLLKGRWIKVTATNRLSRELLETFATRTRTRTRKEPSFLPTSIEDPGTLDTTPEGTEGTQNGSYELPPTDSILRSMP